ncbi:uncharacterized protein LOC131429076 [Malaya genurostris]|uniref:uncharacterized protein LOC131429076 n=1 Tax=Malaya genurostris TaxID=325434 RepID=UPI0026F3C824|nr:uncharacterized protein LOC131429076 [Malaya genurostris]
MERFAINILHKQIYKICRLCGVDNPVKFPIIEENETVIVGDEDEATLVRKIEECVGIQVSKDDRMPQNICSLCVDKINDFFEYRLMCAATNLQTRTILNLPLVDPTRKLLPLIGDSSKPEVKDFKTDVKKVEAASTSGVSSTSSNKKGKKRRASPSPSPSPAPTTRVKAAVDIVKDEPVPTTPVKALTKKERLKQLQQQQKQKEENKIKDDKKKLKEDERKKIKDEDKRKIKDEDKKKIKDEDRKKVKDEEKKKKEDAVESSSDLKQTRSKRKELTPPKEIKDAELSVPAPKKIKFEHPCSYCSDEFKTQAELDGHLCIKHIPVIRKFGCGSCRETFETVLEFKDHNLWHQLTRTLYTCFKCKRKYDKNVALIKHISLNACGRVSRGRPPAIKPDVQCRLCNKKFKTQNLYEWHSCFLKPKANCPKCNKFFVKKPVLTRHYMMFCTGSLPPPEPVIIPKEEPVDSADKKIIGSPAIVLNSAARRTRGSVPTEQELPKEEREIPFPPPLELAQEAAASSPSVSKKKTLRHKENVEAHSPGLETAKIASLLDSGAKLGRDTDIATINNLLSSVTEAIASLSEAKAKKKKKKKDKNKEKDRPEEELSAGNAGNSGNSPRTETSHTETHAETPPVETPSPVDDSTVAIAMEVGEMSLDQQLAFCSDKLPMVVLAKTQFKQECTEIDTEPSQLQEPMDEDEDEEDDFVDNSVNDYSDFQDADEDAEEGELESRQRQKESQLEKESTNESTAEEEEIPFPMPIKQEEQTESQNEINENEDEEQVEHGGKSPTQTAPLQTPDLPSVDSEATEKDTHFDEQLALNIKKEPGLEEECEAPPAKRKRPGSHPSHKSNKIDNESPKPLLILKIKKEKGLLNASVPSTPDIRTIVLDDDDDDGNNEPAEKPIPSKSKKMVYKKPNFLAVKIKQEKIDPAYEKIVDKPPELPVNVQIKQEPVDEDLPPTSVAQEKESGTQTKVTHKKHSILNDNSVPTVVAFDGVRIKQEKPENQPVALTDLPPAQDPKPVEKKKKSKVKINPFALLKQRMAAEVAAKNSNEPNTPAMIAQASSPLPVITNVVGNAPAESSLDSSSGRNIEERVAAESITQAPSNFQESEQEFPMPIKQEVVEEQTEYPDTSSRDEQKGVDHDFPMPIKEEVPEGVPDDVPEDASDEVEPPEFPMPIKEELGEPEANDDEPTSELEENVLRTEATDETSNESRNEELASARAESAELEMDEKSNSGERVVENDNASHEPLLKIDVKTPDEKGSLSSESSTNAEMESVDDEKVCEEVVIQKQHDAMESVASSDLSEKLQEENEFNDEVTPRENESKNSADLEVAENRVSEGDPSKFIREDDLNNCKEIEQPDQKELLGDEQEQTTSSISDIPMDEYAQSSNDSIKDSNNTEAAEDKEKNIDLFPAICENQEDKSCEKVSESTSNGSTIQKVSPVCENQEDKNCETASENTTNDGTIQDVLQREIKSPVEPLMDQQEQLSSDSTTPAVLPLTCHPEISPSHQQTSSQSVIDEIQNLLTEGLKPVAVVDPGHPVALSVDASSTATAEASNNRSGLDDLDSLLNNKLEEISDQLKSLPTDAESTTANQDEAISLALERELLDEMIPPIENQNSDALRKEINSASANSSKNCDNSMPLVEENSVVDENVGSKS